MQDVGFATCNAEVETGSLRVETHGGRDHLVAPVVAVREMVLKGEFLPASEIQASAPAWNGRVLPIGHPTTDDGEFMSANAPEVHDTRVVGKFFGAEVPDTELTGEIWVDIERSRRLYDETGDTKFVKPLTILASHADDEVANAVREAASNDAGECPCDDVSLSSQDVLEVSTAYFYNRQEALGTHDGESYEATQHNLRPDHLALLPNSVGECSVEDGCGAPRAHVHANVDDAAVNKRVAGVQFSGTAGGKLDEGALDPDEHTLSDHYLYGSGDTKDDFSYPVVDASGDLRRGNVTSAWELGCRGQCDSEENHRERVRKLAREFDNVPEFAQDGGQNDAQHFGATPNEPAAVANSGTSMTEEDIEWLASHTDFDRETLETFEESHLETLKASVESAKGGHADGCQCNECAGQEQNGQTNSGDDDADPAVEELRSEFQSEIDELREKLNEKEREEREGYVETIVENSDRFDEASDLEHIDDLATLEAMADEFQSRQAVADMGGRIGAGGSPGGDEEDKSDYLSLAKRANPARFGEPESTEAD